MKVKKLMKITIDYNGKLYVFEHGYQALIFESAICNYLDKRINKPELEAFVKLVTTCYLKDDNPTPLGELSDYIFDNWDNIKLLSPSAILAKFYLQL